MLQSIVYSAGALFCSWPQWFFGLLSDWWSGRCGFDLCWVCNILLWIWLWNIFYCHSLPSADSRRAVVSFWWKNVYNTGLPLRGLSLSSESEVRSTDWARHDTIGLTGMKTSTWTKNAKNTHTIASFVTCMSSLSCGCNIWLQRILQKNQRAILSWKTLDDNSYL